MGNFVTLRFPRKLLRENWISQVHGQQENMWGKNCHFPQFWTSLIWACSSDDKSYMYRPICLMDWGENQSISVRHRSICREASLDLVLDILVYGQPRGRWWWEKINMGRRRRGRKRYRFEKGESLTYFQPRKMMGKCWNSAAHYEHQQLFVRLYRQSLCYLCAINYYDCASNLCDLKRDNTSEI